MNLRLPLVLALAAGLAAAGCAQEKSKSDVVRPVRTVVVDAASGEAWTLPGEVRARYETRLAFRLPGQMIERRVEVGQRVAAGTVIARIDARDAGLAESQARAQLAQAESQASLAESDLKRFAELRTRNFISQAEYDRREAQARQAREQVAAARAAAMQASNQVGYAVLVAPHAGVITALEAETGQVLAAGQTVARLARPDELEIAVSVPEHRLHDFTRTAQYQVSLWAAPGASYVGRLREISPVADPATRTYAARIAVKGEDSRLSIGMTAELHVRGAGGVSPRLPVSAVFHRDGKPAVWVVSHGKVDLVPVTTGDLYGNDVAITAGLAAGQRVVTAGVNRLEPGQRVALLEDAKVAARTP
ncbi:MAG TPA: efflux RND transporter periplasmic adaptor subunit [Burkholderiales bacterium]|nr:efflux RND transporter periplasmic adaptor subunit [Burkholderiales bacterium]